MDKVLSDIHYGKRKRQLWRRALPILVLTWCVGCGQKKPGTIMVITPTGGLEYWEDFDRAVEANAKAAGIHTELAAPQSVTDYTERAQMVETAITGTCRGSLFHPRINWC
jgi:ABC-type sugar transport system substrate-binding protein